MKVPSFITLKVPIFHYIDQDYLTLFFFVQSDLVSRESSGGTCNTYLRYKHNEVKLKQSLQRTGNVLPFALTLSSGCSTPQVGCVKDLIHFGIKQNKKSQPAIAQTGSDQRNQFDFLPFISLFNVHTLLQYEVTK